MTAILRRELQGFFHTMLGYIYISFMTLIIGILFTAFHLRSGRAEFSYTLNSLTMVLILVTPILTMHSLSAEHRQKTDQMLFTAPVTVADIVLGKFFSIFILFSIPILLSLLCPVVLSRYGSVPLLSTLCCFPPFLLMGACCIAIGLFISSFTDNPVLTAVETFGLLFLIYLLPSIINLLEKNTGTAVIGFACMIVLLSLLLYFILKSRVVCLIHCVLALAVLAGFALRSPALLTGSFFRVLDQLTLFNRFETFAAGVFSVHSIVYYLTVTFLFLVFTAEALEIRRWS